MKMTTRYITAFLAAGAIGTIGFAPIANAATGSAQAHSASTDNAPSQYESGTDPLVPANTGAMPFVLVPYGYGRAF
jgi:hypothetical protein